jgi:hypothetical protein
MSEWQGVKLKDVCAINPRRDKSVDHSTEISFIEMKSLLENGSVYPKIAQAEKYLRGYTPFKHRDILVAKITPCFQNGKIGIANLSTEFGFGTTEFHILRTNSDVLPEYLTAFLRQEHVLIAGEKQMTGSGGQRRVPKAFLEQLNIPLPPLREQKRIAEMLGKVTNSIHNIKYELELLGRLPLFDWNWTGETQNLANIATVRSGTVNPTLAENLILPLIAPDSIEKNTGKLLETKTCEEAGVISGKYRFYKGDVLYSKIRPYLNKVTIAPYDGLCSADMYALETKGNFTPEILQAILMSRKFLSYTSQASGRASIPKVNRKTLLTYKVPRLSDAQIFEITNKIQAINNTKELLHQKLALLQELQRSISARAFTGQL